MAELDELNSSGALLETELLEHQPEADKHSNNGSVGRAEFLGSILGTSA